MQLRLSTAHAAGGGGDGAAARALPAVARRHQEAHRGAHRARVPGAHARRPQGLHLRRIGAYPPTPACTSPAPRLYARPTRPSSYELYKGGPPFQSKSSRAKNKLTFSRHLEIYSIKTCHRDNEYLIDCRVVFAAFVGHLGKDFHYLSFSEETTAESACLAALAACLLRVVLTFLVP